MLVEPVQDSGPTFTEFVKIYRLSRDMIVTEKLDGTNASITIDLDGQIRAGSRNRYITPKDDNFGFARWVEEHAEELQLLGPGQHFGEWWGRGIQRGYGLAEKRFSLFNVTRWGDPATRPACVGVVPVLHTGLFDTGEVDRVLANLAREGSAAAPGFPQPEGVVVFHVPSGALFKKTLDKNDGHKGTK